MVLSPVPSATDKMSAEGSSTAEFALGGRSSVGAPAPPPGMLNAPFVTAYCATLLRFWSAIYKCLPVGPPVFWIVIGVLKTWPQLSHACATAPYVPGIKLMYASSESP